MPFMTLCLPDIKQETEERPNQCPHCDREIFQRWGATKRMSNDCSHTYASIAGTILDVRCGTNAWNLCIASGSQQFCCFVENVTNNNPHIHHLLKSKKARLSIERQTLDRCRAYVTVCRLHGYLHPAPLVPRWCPRGHRSGISYLVVFAPPLSLLMLSCIIYNHVSNGRGYKMGYLIAFVARINSSTS